MDRRTTRDGAAPHAAAWHSAARRGRGVSRPRRWPSTGSSAVVDGLSPVCRTPHSHGRLRPTDRSLAGSLSEGAGFSASVSSCSRCCKMGTSLPLESVSLTASAIHFELVPSTAILPLAGFKRALRQSLLQPGGVPSEPPVPAVTPCKTLRNPCEPSANLLRIPFAPPRTRP